MRRAIWSFCLSALVLVSVSPSPSVRVTLSELEELETILRTLQATLTASKMDLINSQEALRREQARLELLATDLENLSRDSALLSIDLAQAREQLSVALSLLRDLESELAQKDLERWVFLGAGVLLGGLVYGLLQGR
jgi:hypothetical protein